MVLHKVLGPKPPLTADYLEHIRTIRSQDLQPRICTDCKDGVTPIQTKIEPDFHCVEGLPEERVMKMKVFVNPCPEYCLKQEADEILETQSGPVPVRHCKKIRD